jgi:hypothetical protein
VQLTDFDLHQLVFEVRYDDAFEVWDCAGLVHRELVSVWPGVKLADTNPNQQILKSADVQIQTGIRTSHVLLFDPGSVLKREDQIADTFAVWRSSLDLRELKRVGTRAVFRKRFSTEEQAGIAFMSIGLVKLPQDGTFLHSGVSPSLGELRLQWKTEAVHTTLSFKSQQQQMELPAIPEFEKPSEKLTRDDLILDIDRATGKPMDVSQFDPREWLKSFQRLCSKDLPRVLA